MELSETDKLHLCFIFIIGVSISALIFDHDTSHHTMYVMSIIISSILYAFMLVMQKKSIKTNWIKRNCPTIYSVYFVEDSKLRLEVGHCYQENKEYFLGLLCEQLLKEEKELKNRVEQSKKYGNSVVKDIISNLIHEERNDIWLIQAKSFLKILYNAKSKNSKEITLLEQEIVKYEKSLVPKAIVQHSIKENPDDITHDDIINQNVEFEEDAIYVKEKIWDGFKYTISKQRVFVYKRDYNLNQDIPRFHICKCKTMDEFIRAGALTTSYRKSINRTVLVKNKDEHMQECEISHLPLCKNCYNKMKEQYSWLNSETDNIDFIKNVINKTNWGPEVK